MQGVGNDMIVRRKFSNGDVFYEIVQYSTLGPDGKPVPSSRFVVFIRPGGAGGVNEECLRVLGQTIARLFDSEDAAIRAADEHLIGTHSVFPPAE